MVVNPLASFLLLLMRFILFSFSRSKTDDTFSDRLLSLFCLGFGSDVADADADLTVVA